MLSSLAALVALWATLAHSASLPSASSVGSDLLFLIQNDLNWPTIGDHNGTILLTSARTNAQANAACAKLNENLLPPTGTHFQDDISAITRYLSFNKEFGPTQSFWIGSNKQSDAQSTAGGKASCTAFSPANGLHSVSCSASLPTFCSQSAPNRRNIQTDLSPQFQVQVTSKKLTVVGTRDHLSFRFIGIPYADPFQRFEYSKPFSSSTTIQALNYGSPCFQGTSGSEDCLFINIYTPFLPQSGSKSKNLRPVLFWIHGGGFTGGEGSDGIFDGGNMVSRSDVVVVSINYRLGTLGFLALPDGKTNGNYGIADQVTALQWVQEHIADFGGDPSRVTIYGQSAGAGSVRALLAAKPAFGLFAGAIAQSNLGGFGYAHTYTEYMSIQDEFTNFGEGVVQAVGCGSASDVLGCLRGVSASDLINAPNAPRYIVIDGKFITTDHLILNGKGPAAKAHVVFGWMRDDGADFIGSFPTTTSTLTGQLTLSGLPSDIAAKVVGSSLFPTPSGSNSTLDLFNVTSRIGTDGEFLCIDQATVISAAKHNVFQSVWAYQFDRSYAGFEPIPGTCEPAATPEFPNGDPSLPYFRCHSGELYYMFGTLGQDLRPFRDSNDLLMSQTSVDAWGSFARTFNPNPSLAYLSARGYTTTIQALQKWGTWNPVSRSGGTNKGENPLRILDTPATNSGWREEAQCDLLGYPSNMFEQ